MACEALGHSDPCHRHPSYICYGRGCRCPDCKAAHSTYQKAVRRRHREKNPSRQGQGGGRKPHSALCPEHPSLTCYRSHRCRCVPCRALGKAWREEKEAQRTDAQRREAEARRRRASAMPEAEVLRLRRLVGLNPDGTERMRPKSEMRTW